MVKCTKFQWILIITFIITGTLTTLLNKWSDHQVVVGINDVEHKFNHPFVQTFFMFLGEFFCGCIYYGVYFYLKYKGNGDEDTSQFTKGSRNFNIFLMLPACLFDLCGTSCCFVGLNLTYASSFQMFRGAVIIFTGIFSVIFLKKHLKVSEIFGMLFVVLGLSIVGLCDFFLTTDEEDIEPISAVIGDFIIILGQVFLAFMMVYQQKMYFTKLDIPALQAVGLEGFFGVIAIIIVIIIFYFCHVGETFGKNPRQVIEDGIDACIQMQNNIWIFWALFANSFLTTIYNYVGLTITKEISALTRKVLDSARTVTVWVFAIILFGQIFRWQTVIGFIVLLSGLFLYNDISVFGKIMKKNVE